MGRYLVRGFLQAIVLVVLVSIIVFALIHAAPGGPGAVMADDRLSPDEIARMRANLGLDKPLPVQYVEWARNLLTGDFGISYADGRPVLDTILQRVPNTLILAGTAFLLSLAVAIPPLPSSVMVASTQPVSTMAMSPSMRVARSV